MEPEGVCGFHQYTEGCYDRTIILFRSRSLREKEPVFTYRYRYVHGRIFEEDDEERENTEENKRSLAISHGLFTALLPVLVSNEIAHPAHRVAHYTLYNIVKAGSILSDTFRLSYFHPVVETGRAPSLQLGIYIHGIIK